MKVKILSCNGFNITAEVADSFFTRLRGLLGRDCLSAAHGLLIIPCNQIHCFFMRFEIDAIFISKDNTVLHIIRHMQRGAVSPVVHGAKYVLELGGGDAEKINIGDCISGIND